MLRKKLDGVANGHQLGTGLSHTARVLYGRPISTRVLLKMEPLSRPCPSLTCWQSGKLNGGNTACVLATTSSFCAHHFLAYHLGKKALMQSYDNHSPWCFFVTAQETTRPFCERAAFTLISRADRPSDCPQSFALEISIKGLKKKGKTMKKSFRVAFWDRGCESVTELAPV